MGEVVSVAATFCVVSATLSAGICCFAKTLGHHSQLIDKPDSVRKLHEEETPLVGGVALLIPSLAVSVAYLVLIHHSSQLLTTVIATATVLIVGIVDDRTGISPVWRLLVMMFIIFTAFGLEPLFVLHTLHFGLPGTSAFISLDPFAMPITVLMILGFANAANMADGMNGQLLGSVVVWCLFVSIHLGMAAAVPFIAVICSALVTIVFNLRGKLFSGSSGAYAASTFVALGAILAYRNANGTMPAELPLLWFWLPVVDCVRLIAKRVSAGRSPFSGDRNHFHHMLHDITRRRFALIIYLILLAAPGAAGEFNIGMGLIALAVCFGCYVGLIAYWKAEARKGADLPVVLAPDGAYFGVSRKHPHGTVANTADAALPRTGS